MHRKGEITRLLLMLRFRKSSGTSTRQFTLTQSIQALGTLSRVPQFLATSSRSKVGLMVRAMKVLKQHESKSVLTGGKRGAMLMSMSWRRNQRG